MSYPFTTADPLFAAVHGSLDQLLDPARFTGRAPEQVYIYRLLLYNMYAYLLYICYICYEGIVLYMSCIILNFLPTCIHSYPS